MLRVNSVRIKLADNNSEGFFNALVKKLHISGSSLLSFEPSKISIDARKKEDIHYVCSFDVCIKNEEQFIQKNRDKDIFKFEKKAYEPFIDFYTDSEIKEKIEALLNSGIIRRPVVVGAGPCGLFCALKLAQAGLKPLLIERGEDVDSRKASVEAFWNGGPLRPQSNVQFGEGGAGTFSDGKLNTMVKDRNGRMGEVYRIFIEHGADEKIAYMNKPHIGTDRLCQIVKDIRGSIIELGGEIRFNTCLTDIIIEKDRLKAIQVNNTDIVECDKLVLAIGHSARDTFELLLKRNTAMEKKSFAIGVRVQHPQQIIDEAQYGSLAGKLPAADYKLTCNLDNGRSIYSFCMCPGGYVVNASSENNCLCVNGMSYSGRDGSHANSAIVVSVTPSDFPANNVLAGMEFQRSLEGMAYKAGSGKIPVQTLKAFKNSNEKNICSEKNYPDCKGIWTYADINSIIPPFMSSAIKEAFPSFGRQINGFDDDDTLLIGLEARTSSPIRINRGEDYQSINIKGLYPAGEGAGYAGGITSAAMDGLKVYEAIIRSLLDF